MSSEACPPKSTLTSFQSQPAPHLPLAVRPQNALWPLSPLVCEFWKPVGRLIYVCKCVHLSFYANIHVCVCLCRFSCVSMYMYASLYICVYMFLFLCEYVCIYVSVCACVSVYVFKYACHWVHVYTHVYIFVHTCVSIYVHTCVLILTETAHSESKMTMRL